MLEFIRNMLSRWFESRRKKIAKMNGEIPDEVEKELIVQLKASAGLSVVVASKWDYEVGDSCGERYHVSLEACTCTRKEFQILMLPCRHAMAAATTCILEFHTLVGELHKKLRWDGTLVGVILLLQDTIEVDTHDGLLELLVMPPTTRCPPGRLNTECPL